MVTEEEQEEFEQLIRDFGGHLGMAQDEYQRRRIPEEERCIKCEGTGNQMLSMYQQCSDCKGTGRKDG